MQQAGGGRSHPAHRIDELSLDGYAAGRHESFDRFVKRGLSLRTSEIASDAVYSLSKQSGWTLSLWDDFGLGQDRSSRKCSLC